MRHTSSLFWREALRCGYQTDQGKEGFADKRKALVSARGSHRLHHQSVTWLSQSFKKSFITYVRLGCMRAATMFLMVNAVRAILCLTRSRLSGIDIAPRKWKRSVPERIISKSGWIKKKKKKNSFVVWKQCWERSLGYQGKRHISLTKGLTNWKHYSQVYPQPVTISATISFNSQHDTT